MAGYANKLQRSTANELPIDVQREVIQAVVEQSAVLQLAQRKLMPSHTLTMPALATFPDAYWLDGATRAAEDFGFKQTTTMTWDNVTLAAAEIAVTVPLSDAQVQDQLFDVLGELKPRIAESIGIAIDRAALWGDGKPTLWSGAAGSGIYDLAVGAGNVVTPATVVDGDTTPDLGQQFGYAAQLLSEDGFDVSGVAARRGLKWRLMNLRDSTGQPIYQGNDAGISGGAPSTLYGEPLHDVANGAWDNNRAVMMLGDWRWAMVGIRQDLTFSVHRDGVISDPATGLVTYNAVTQDGFILRCSMRVAFATANPRTRLNTNDSTRFPFAVVTPTGAPSS